MDFWENDLLVKKKEAEEKLAKIKDEQRIFLAKNITPSTPKEQTYLDAIKTMHEMLVLLAEQSLSHIEEEIRRLNKLATYRAGSDSIINE